MIRPSAVLAAILLIWTVPSVAAGQEVGGLYFMTGCDEHGVPQLDLINVWTTAAGGRIVGHLSGAGRPDTVGRCSGSVVIVRAIRTVNGRRRIRIEAVIGDTKGWVTDFFIGRPFKLDCGKFFKGDATAIKKCRSARPGG